MNLPSSNGSNLVRAKCLTPSDMRHTMSVRVYNECQNTGDSTGKFPLEIGMTFHTAPLVLTRSSSVIFSYKTKHNSFHCSPCRMIGLTATAHCVQGKMMVLVNFQ